MRFDEFLTTLQSFEGVRKPKVLIGEWDKVSIGTIRKYLVEVQSDILGKKPKHKGWKNLSNQAKGNAIADFLVARMAGTKNFQAELVSTEKFGKGYPDKILRLNPGGIMVFAELKATSNWDEKDTNRRVFTSSSLKQRNILEAEAVNLPPKHLLITAVFESQNGEIKSIRIDFLVPGFDVNLRLEASSSHKALANGNTNSLVVSQKVQAK